MNPSRTGFIMTDFIAILLNNKTNDGHLKFWKKEKYNELPDSLKNQFHQFYDSLYKDKRIENSEIWKILLEVGIDASLPGFKNQPLRTDPNELITLNITPNFNRVLTNYFQDG